MTPNLKTGNRILQTLGVITLYQGRPLQVHVAKMTPSFTTKGRGSQGHESVNARRDDFARGTLYAPRYRVPHARWHVFRIVYF